MQWGGVMRTLKSFHNVTVAAVLAAGTALPLILAVPLGSMARGPGELAPAPVASTPASGEPAQAAPGTSEPASEMSADPATTTPPVSPDPVASIDSQDRAIAEKIRELLANKPDQFFASRKDRAAVAAFYQNRGLAPLWLDKGVENARAKSAIARMKSAESDGLEPADYRPPSFGTVGSDGLAEAELKLTETVLTFARHLQAGRFPYTRVSQNIELPQTPPEPADILDRIAGAADAGQALESFSPQQAPYRKLKAMLAELRSKLGPAKGDVSRQIEIVVANMERWRWYPRDLGGTHVLVNQPDFTLAVMRNDTQVWTTRIVIGKPSMPTPLLSETMKYITINPTWHVPQSIVRNEYLPALAQDPTVLERMGLRVSYSGGEVQITQPPGEGNALGRIRFNFPNRFSVYQHDTPDKQLFGHEVRAYSHGCMRVQDPAKYAEVLLNLARPHERWSADRVRSMFGSAEQDIQLPSPIWVHLTYQTAFVDNAGKLQFRHDVYNLDGRTIAAIKNHRGIQEAAPQRKREHQVTTGSGPNGPAPWTRVGGSLASPGFMYR
jgi:murein L,D-transpeptidase YcbB/YkuD